MSWLDWSWIEHPAVGSALAVAGVLGGAIAFLGLVLIFLSWTNATVLMALVHMII